MVLENEGKDQLRNAVGELLQEMEGNAFKELSRVKKPAFAGFFTLDLPPLSLPGCMVVKPVVGVVAGGRTF